MIVIMIDDDYHRTVARRLATQYNEKIVLFAPNCFAKMDPSDTRITLIGHSAGRHLFGAQQLPTDPYVANGQNSDDLIENLFKYGMPKTVTDMDVIGCEVAFTPHDETAANFSKSFAPALFWRAPHIKTVNAISNAVIPEKKLLRMAVSSAEGGKFYIRGIEDTPTHREALKEINEQNKTLLKKRLDCRQKKNAPQSVTLLSAPPEDIKNELAKIDNELQKVHERYTQLLTIVYTIDDLRKSLDTVPEFQHKAPQEYKDFHDAFEDTKSDDEFGEFASSSKKETAVPPKHHSPSSSSSGLQDSSAVKKKTGDTQPLGTDSKKNNTP